MNLIGDPEEMEALAARYELRAAQLDEALQRLHASFTNATWTCAKADRWRAHVQRQRRDASAIAVELRGIAAALRRSAAAVRAELDLIHRLERAVRAALDALVAGATATPESIRITVERAIDPCRLPPSGDPAWRSVARDLGIT